MSGWFLAYLQQSPFQEVGYSLAIRCLSTGYSQPVKCINCFVCFFVLLKYVENIAKSERGINVFFSRRNFPNVTESFSLQFLLLPRESWVGSILTVHFLSFYLLADPIAFRLIIERRCCVHPI